MGLKSTLVFTKTGPNKTLCPPGDYTVSSPYPIWARHRHDADGMLAGTSSDFFLVWLGPMGAICLSCTGLVVILISVCFCRRGGSFTVDRGMVHPVHTVPEMGQPLPEMGQPLAYSVQPVVQPQDRSGVSLP